ncbi:MAG: ATP-dependent helicase [Myxococcota bacterium]
MHEDDPILSGLNAPQRDAVLANDGPVLILAGAGSGKTRAITHKIAWLVGREGYAPWNILAVTFTNKAAREMKERCTELIGPENTEDLWLGTFHRIGVQILRRHGQSIGVDPRFTIYDQDDQKAMVKRVLKELNYSKDAIDPKQVQKFINRAKQRGRTPAKEQDARRLDPHDPLLKAYKLYEQRMRESGAVDFGDLILLPLLLVREYPVIASEFKQRWKYILVDEFQDTNKVQYDLLKAVLNDASRICVVGDDDQSIYRWRGAEVENILGFEDEFPDTTVIRLEQNYRSSANILEAAGELIRKNRTRHDKKLWTEREAGAPIRLHTAATDTAEAEYIAKRVEALRDRHPLREMAVFYRTHAQSRAIEDALRQHRIPYVIIGGLKFYERAEVKDLMAYLRVLVNPSDAVSLERIINTPTRGIGARTVERIRGHAVEAGVSMWDACRNVAATGTKGMQKKLRPFVDLVEELMRVAESGSGLAAAQATLERIGYIERLRAEGTPEADARIENLHELLNAIDEYQDRTGDSTLAGFLEQVALVADIDRAELEDDAVVMMSAHTAKGLEFDVVFLTGLEHGLLPHFNAIDDPTGHGQEEERRLTYVAMTRARHHLHLSHAEYRRRFGTIQAAIASPFLEDLPGECVQPDLGGHHRGAFFDDFPRPTRSTVRRRPKRERPAPAPDFSQAMPDYESFSQEEFILGPGAPVFHPTFGEGKVVDLSGSGPSARVRVRFAGGVEKRIVAKFLTPAP